MPEPKWLTPKTTRAQSGKQEKNLAKKFNGRLTSNSGAKFGENDIVSESFEIEAKTTKQKGYSISIEEFKTVEKKCRTTKIPIMIVEFQNHKRSLVVISLEDFERMKNCLQK